MKQDHAFGLEKHNCAANAELLRALSAPVDGAYVRPPGVLPEKNGLAATQAHHLSALSEELWRQEPPAPAENDALPAGHPQAAEWKAIYGKLRRLTRQARNMRRADTRQTSDLLRELTDSFRELSDSFQPRTNERQNTVIRILNNLPLLVFVLDSREHLLFANQAAVNFWRAYGAEGSDAGKLLTTIAAGHLPPPGAVSVFYESRGGRWYQLEAASMKWAAEKNAVLYTLMDITEVKSSEEVLRAAAQKDAMTGVYRRETGLSVFREVMRNRGADAAYVVAFLDIDDLKGINDRHGHPAGDAAIRGTAEILQKSLRDSDIILRAGGDEFIFILIGSDEQAAGEVIRRVFRNLDEFNQTTQLPFLLKFSVGLSDAASEPADIEHLIQAADARMYERKRWEK